MNDKELIPQLFSNKVTDSRQIFGNGDVNRVFVVEIGNEKFIVRLNEAGELPRFQKEAWCQEQSLMNGILTSKTMEVGIKDGAAYMILEYIPGINGKEATDNKGSIWRTIGKYARASHSIKVGGFSENMISPGIFSDSWQRYLDYNINSLDTNDKLLSLGIITSQQSKEILEQFLKLQNYSFKFGLVHGDLSLSNTIVKDDKVTLIDWGCAEASIVPHIEFVDLFHNQTFNHDLFLDDFLVGYGMTKQEFDLIKQEIDMLNLLQAVDKLRWAIDKSPEKIEEFTQRVKTIINT